MSVPTLSRWPLAALIIAAVLVAWFVLSVPRTTEAPRAAHAPTATSTPPSVTLHDVYKKGVHTLSGTVLAPDACAIASAEATTSGTASTSESIALAIVMPPTAGVCVELPTPISFSTSIAAPSGLPITVTVNGLAASTTPS